ncbi:HD domain-containing protein [Cardinium endosymbiont cBtQ1 of Bemisia tabaci]|nr:HD domain-containing protein [Cardinium endosymbiont cBtQ1 of Bemisia tabaci]
MQLIPTNNSYKKKLSAKMALVWLLSVLFCFPVNVLWHWSGTLHGSLAFILALSIAHLAVTLFILPLRISGQLVAFMLLVIVYAIYCRGTDLLLKSSNFLICLVGLSLILFFIIVYQKHKLANYTDYSNYLKEKQIKEQEINQTEFSLNSNLETIRDDPKEADVVIDQMMKGITKFIAYLDNRPIYKEDLNLIINNFVIWDIFLKQRARSRNNVILIPSKVSFDELIQKLEVGLELECKQHTIPKFMIGSKDDKLPEKIICDVNQVVSLLTSVLLSMASLDTSNGFVSIQCYTTYLEYELARFSEDKSTTDVRFPAIALVIGHGAIPEEALPKIKNCYQNIAGDSQFNWHSVVQKESEWANIEKRNIQQIVRTHYGYLQFPTSPKKPMLVVLPCNVAAVRDKMIAAIIPSSTFIGSKELKISMIVLKKAYNSLCTLADMRPTVLDELFLLIRRCYGFRRHASGQLFYVRALGIAELVAKWVPYQPKPVYFSLLYGLVRYGGLPLPYVKANYSIDVYSFIENIISVNKRQDMEPCGLYIGSRLKRIINREQLFIPCIKFAERLYDLRHAKDYTSLEEVKHMAQETLTIDVELGKKYLNANIVEELVEAANQALQACKGIC